jgi:hypothetical protein
MSLSLLHDPIFTTAGIDGSPMPASLVTALTDPRVRSLEESPDVNAGVVRVAAVFVAKALIHAGIIDIDDPSDSDALEDLFLDVLPFLEIDDASDAITQYAGLEHIQAWFDIDNPNGLGRVEGVIPSEQKFIDGKEDSRHTLFPLYSSPVASPLLMDKAGTINRLVALSIIAPCGNHPEPKIDGVPRPPTKVFKTNGVPRKDRYPYGYGAALYSPLTYVVGDTFFQTVMNAMTPELVWDAFVTPAVWELPKPTETPWGDSSGERMTGPVAVLTYPTRHVYVKFDGDALFNAQVYPGDGRPVHIVNEYDPMVPPMVPVMKKDVPDVDEYGNSKYLPPIPYGSSPLRSWHSAKCVIPVVTEENGDSRTSLRASKAVLNARNLNDARGGNGSLAVNVMSAVFTSDASRKLLGVYEDRMDIPSFLVTSPPNTPDGSGVFPSYVQTVNDNITAVTAVADELAKRVKLIETNGANKCLPLRSEEYRVRFLFDVDQPFRAWLAGLPVVDWESISRDTPILDELGEYCDQWHVVLRKHVMALFDEYTSSLSSRTWYTRKVSRQYAYLHTVLNKIVPIQKPTTEETK